MIKPTPQYQDQPNYNGGRDSAGSGSFSLYALERLISDCADQPPWRDRADLACAYYDGKQLSPLQLQTIRAEGLDERSTNLIRPVINSVLGQEAKSRTDIKIEADDDDYQDVCDALNPRLKEAERETRAHMAVSNAYGSDVKAGIGWVEVSRNSDPLDYPYRVDDVPRNEIWWDWRAQRGVTLLNACRWLCRKRWIDLDEIEAKMPEHKDVLKRTVSGWDSLMVEGYLLGEPNQALMNALDTERRFQVARRDWVDSARKMIKMYEVWYRVPASVVVLQMSPTKRIQYDPKDPRHVEAVARGLVKVSKAITMQVRMALYAGPHRLLDVGTTKRNFPYIPFFAFRDDQDLSPYGLIEGMISPQDEYNERRLRIQWMLKAKQIQIDDDALATEYNTIADIADAVMRPDLQIITNPNRKNVNGIKIGNDLTLQRDQVEVMQDAKQLIQDTAGRYSSQLGNRPAGVTSGIANSLLIEQGEQAMGEMNDNYAFARRQVFETLLQEIVQDHLNENLNVMVGVGKTKRAIVLNTWDPQTGQPVNQVKDADVKVAMSEVPSTPAYRQQMQANVATIIQALGNNPQAVAILAPVFLESSNIPNRQQVADDLRKMSGIPIAGDKAGQEKADADQAQQAQANKQAQAAVATAEIADKQANTQARNAAARLANANATLIEQRIQNGVASDKDKAETAQVLSVVDLNEAKAEQARGQIQASNDALIADALAQAMA
jgi:hypothetical protein